MQFAEVTASTQPRQWKGRINPCYHDQVEQRRQMIKQKGQGLMDLRGGNHVVVFQDKYTSMRQGSKFIEERPEHQFQGRSCYGVEQCESGLADTWLECLAGRNDVTPETDRIVVTWIK